MKKGFIMLFAVLTLLLCLPLVANAEIVEQGSCGDNVTYTLDDQGTLTISGTGETQRYSIYGYTVRSPFFGNTDIKSVFIEDGITKLNSNLFYNCTSIANVHLPDSLTLIEGDVFYNCESLKNITIPKNVVSISSLAFTGCSNLEKVVMECEKCSTGSLGCPFKYAKEVKFTDTVKEIGSTIFKNSENLTKVIIDSNVSGEQSFQGTNLTDVNFTDNVTVIHPSLFQGCGTITHFNVSPENKSYVNIGSAVFSTDKTKLILYPKGISDTQYIIPDSVTELGAYSFSNSAKLTSITMPDTVTTIGVSAFSTCTKLTSITIPNSINRIPSSAFSSCRRLQSVVIPLSIQNIANNAFENCTALSDIYYEGNAEQWRAVNIGTVGNDYIGNAIIHYNITSIPDDVTPTPEPDPTPVPYTPLECNVDYKVEGENITFTVEVKDIARADELKSVQLYTAEFDENGRFTGLTTAKNSTVQDGKITITSNVPQADTYKFFLWDGHFAPLMNVLDNESITTQ
ncbi:MAG: leucine-rich repeat protein [Clostridia bacterium]|nr:leucine-rich repeat protein [Clostridia bacterium]MBQ3463610.1 leucine-rich repeat protein [Clostridia bacterium]MBQ6530613.1 leucine-rich repeat protein [Clostridia bacterium]MBQ7574177.1 leucine-rich repeat protein [Clostridia bacterium]